MKSREEYGGFHSWIPNSWLRIYNGRSEDPRIDDLGLHPILGNLHMEEIRSHQAKLCFLTRRLDAVISETTLWYMDLYAKRYICITVHMLLELRRTTSVNKRRKTIRHANLNDTNTSANVTGTCLQCNSIRNRNN